MKLDDAKEIIKEYVDKPIVNFQIEKAFLTKTSDENYNQTIRQKLEGRKSRKSYRPIKGELNEFNESNLFSGWHLDF